MKLYRMSKERRDIEWVTKNLKLCYADDAIIAKTENDLHRLLYEFYMTARQYNISTEKTKLIVIAKEPIRCKLVVEDRSIEHIMEVGYLGIKITSIGKIEEQVNKANRIPGCFNDTILRNKFFPLKLKYLGDLQTRHLEIEKGVKTEDAYVI